MSIKSLIFILIATQCITTATFVCGTVRAMDSIGLTNLQKISMVLKETQEIQRQEIENRQKNVVLARALLKSCDQVSDTGERATCERKYQAIVKSSMRVCGADC